jgi:hypothetical protein
MKASRPLLGGVELGGAPPNIWLILPTSRAGLPANTV